MREFALATFPKRAAPDTMRFFTADEAAQARAFHQTLPGYAATRLFSLDAAAERLGVAKIWIKDESTRFSLNAFKALGASYAAHLLPEKPKGLITATDGNHGRGVAWTAKNAKIPCAVYLPKGSAQARVENIRKEGAEVTVTDLPYDDTVRLARAQAEKRGYTLMQDTALEGYLEIPRDIMRGYLTMADEARSQLQGENPTHIFLQAGVGSMAGAVAAYWKNLLGENCPMIVVVEPTGYNCHFLSAKAGKIRFSSAGETIMAGLACAEPNPISWELLCHCAKFAACCPDFSAAEGMRALANPLAGDAKITSGESGAAGFGLLNALMTLPALSSMRAQINLCEKSKVLLFSTEGATDPENYRDIVQNGKWPVPAEELCK